MAHQDLDEKKREMDAARELGAEANPPEDRAPIIKKPMPHSPSPKRRAQKRKLSPGSPDASDPESVPGNKVPIPDSVAEAKEGSPVPGPSTLDASSHESEFHMHSVSNIAEKNIEQCNTFRKY